MKLLTVFVAAICLGITCAQLVDEQRISPAPKCNDVCTMEYRPVCTLPVNKCGDCITFGNACALGVYNCNNPTNRYYVYANTACESIGQEDEFPVLS